MGAINGTFRSVETVRIPVPCDIFARARMRIFPL
jgi:hypothetical protein